MPLFGGGRREPAEDTRPRELELTGERIVTADSFVVLVDTVVRYDPVPQPDGPGLGWDPADEVAVHAVVVTALRLAGEAHDREALVAERAPLTDAVSRATAYAPVVSCYRPTVTRLEVRAYEEDAPSTTVFRVVG